MLVRARRHVIAVALLGVLLGGVYLALPASGSGTIASFKLFPSPGAANCLRTSSGLQPVVNVTVTKGDQNDIATLSFQNARPDVAFDLFSVERSNQSANGSPVSIPNFGLAWYQSDAETGHSTTIKTILVNQIFGFDPAVGLAPTNTFHLGLWFNDPQQAFDLGCDGAATSPIVTPFNGDHHAGPLAFISRPSATAPNLGPLCFDPNVSEPSGCNP